MKLFYIANLRLPTEKAHGIQIMKMCEALARAGAKVQLAVPQRRTPITEEPFAYYGVERIFTIRNLFCFDLVSYGKLGFLVEILSFFISAKMAFQKNNGAIYSREWLASLFFKHAVLELHSWPERAGFLHRLSLRRAMRIIVLTSHLKNELLKYGISADKIMVAPDAVDIATFDIGLSKEEARSRLGLDNTKKIVMYSGHLYSWKGADVLAEAALKLPPGILVLFVGGTDRDILNFKERFAGRHNIMIIGRKDPTEIPIWLKAADLLVLPNSGKEKISRFYTSPMKLFEYMASGRPIVASDLPSIREILGEESAYFVASDDAASLAKGISEALNDRARSERLAVRALQDVRKFNWRSRADAIMNFIKS